MLVKDAMQTNVITVNAHATLPEAVVEMQALGAKRLPVLHEGRLVGVLTDGEVNRALPKLSEGLTPWDFAFQAGRLRVREVMRREVLSVGPQDELSRAVRMFLDRRVGGLPVVDEQGKLVGMLTLTSVLRAAARQPDPAWGAVREHMSADALTLTPDLPLPDAAARLTISRLRVMPVVDERFLGVLHERDVRDRVARLGSAHGPTVLGNQFFLHGLSVRDLMRPAGGEVLASVALPEAIRAMLAADVHGLPVLSDGGRLLGVITVSDVLKAMLGQTKAAQVERALSPAGADAAQESAPAWRTSDETL